MLSLKDFAASAKKRIFLWALGLSSILVAAILSPKFDKVAVAFATVYYASIALTIGSEILSIHQSLVVTKRNRISCVLCSFLNFILIIIIPILIAAVVSFYINGMPVDAH